jgi:hypothetical protein
MKLKTIVETDIVDLTDLLSFDSIRIWLGDMPLFECEGYFDIYRRSVLRNKVNMWLNSDGRDEIEGGCRFTMPFYLGVFYGKMVVTKI